MPVTAVLASLTPILWETGIGSDVMKPIAAPIDEEVRVFIDRLRERACRAGIMVAANGITGDNGGLEVARRHLARALEHDIHVLVLTLEELEQVNSSEAMVKMLLDKWIRLKSFLSSI